MWKRIVVYGMILCLMSGAGVWELNVQASRSSKGMLTGVASTRMHDGEVPAAAPTANGLYAKAAVLMDAESGRVLYEKNGDEILPMASTTKIMTCIIALENADLEETVSISAYAASMPKVKLYVKKGEEYRLGDLLYSLMLESHNDVAVAIAEHIGKKYLPAQLQSKEVCEFTKEESLQAVATFADLMNQKAYELGCKNTWFITPNGLDATETFYSEDGEVGIREQSFDTGESGAELTKHHSTTAKELATMMSYCILYSPKKEAFLEITGTPSYTVTSLDGRNSFCTNHNAFLNMMEGAISGKTGFTNMAGYCYVGAVERDGRTYVVALLACGWPNNKSYKWSDTKILMNYGIEEYFYREFGNGAQALGLPDKVKVRNGQTPYIGQTAYVPVEVVAVSDTTGRPDTFCELFGGAQGMLMRADEEVVVNYQMANELEAPVYSGDIIGVITYEVDGIIYKQEEIVVTSDVGEIDLKWCFERVIQGFFY